MSVSANAKESDPPSAWQETDLDPSPPEFLATLVGYMESQGQLSLPRLHPTNGKHGVPRSTRRYAGGYRIHRREGI